MSEEIATFEKVKTAIEHLMASDREPSFTNIHEFIGGGSKLTILNHRKTVLALLKAPISTPPAIVSEFEAARDRYVVIMRNALEADARRECSQLTRLCEMRDNELVKAEQERLEIEAALQYEQSRRLEMERTLTDLRRDHEALKAAKLSLDEAFEHSQLETRAARMEAAATSERRARAVDELQRAKSEHSQADQITAALLRIEQMMPAAAQLLHPASPS